MIPDTSLDTLPMPGAEMTVYSFAIAAEDITAFRRAADWVLTPDGGDPITITLDGSSNAIAEARDTSRQVAEAEDEDTDRAVLTGLPQPAQ